MKKIITVIAFLIIGYNTQAQEANLEGFKAYYEAQNYQDYTVNIIVDETTGRTAQDIRDIMDYVNYVYASANIKFIINNIATGHRNLRYVSSDYNYILSTKFNKNSADLTIYATGGHKGKLTVAKPINFPL